MREGWKEKLQQRQEESFRTKDDSGRFKPIINPLPQGYEIWKCNEGEHLIDIIPYPAGINNPNNIPEGDPAYKLDVWMHRGIGPNDDGYICLAKTFKKDCPICQHRKYLIDEEGLNAKDKEVTQFNATRRVFYNIWVHDNEKEESKGIQIWEVSHYLFDVPLISQSKIPKIEGISVGGWIPFSNPEIGKMISFTRKGKSATSTEFVSFNFFDRKKPIPEELQNKVLCIDDFLYIPTYDEVYNVLHSGEPSKEEEVNERYTPPEALQKPVEKDIPDLSAKKEPEVDPMEARRQARLAAKQQAATPKEENPCPFNHKFGEDLDKFDDCTACSKSDECELEKDKVLQAKEEELKAEAKKEETRRPLSRRVGK